MPTLLTLAVAPCAIDTDLEIRATAVCAFVIDAPLARPTLSGILMYAASLVELCSVVPL